MTSDANTFSAQTRAAINQLKQAKIPTPELDARILLQAASGLSHASLISNSSDMIPLEVLAVFKEYIKRRIAVEPVHRITGERDFFGRNFMLTPDTLVPRDDTEALVECVLETYQSKDEDFRFLEIGTGSGIIAVTLSCELANVNFTATDISIEALNTAKKNAARHLVEERIDFCKKDMFDGLEGSYHAIISNPPYIPSADIKSLDFEVRHHDPIAALDGGEDGLDFYRHIFLQAGKFLRQDGRVFVEIGINQAQSIVTLAQSAGYGEIETKKDYSGITRVICAKWLGA